MERKYRQNDTKVPYIKRETNQCSNYTGTSLRLTPFVENFIREYQQIFTIRQLLKKEHLKGSIIRHQADVSMSSTTPLNPRA